MMPCHLASTEDSNTQRGNWRGHGHITAIFHLSLFSSRGGEVISSPMTGSDRTDSASANATPDSAPAPALRDGGTSHLGGYSYAVRLSAFPAVAFNAAPRVSRDCNTTRVP